MKDQEQITLPHERLDVYGLYLETAGICGDLVANVTHPIVAIDHLERAIESIGINLIHGNSQPNGSAQRIKSLDVSVGSANECAAALDVCVAWQVMDGEASESVMRRFWRIRGMLMGMKRASAARVREEDTNYGAVLFPFATLDMYQVALSGIRWMRDYLDEISLKARIQRRLDISTTGTVLNIAEGHGRSSIVDQNRFMKTAQEHAYQTILILDLMAARNEISTVCAAKGKAIQARVITMLQAWCEKNQNRGKEADA